MGGNKTDVDVTQDAKPILQTGPVLPTVGRVVHYVSQDGSHFAADVVAPSTDTTIMLYVKNPQLRVAEFIDKVPEDQIDKLPHTWHWPERS
jgi:hypothetical protein